MADGSEELAKLKEATVGVSQITEASKNEDKERKNIPDDSGEGKARYLSRLLDNM